MKPIPLTQTGEILIPAESESTDESELPASGVLGKHNCFKGPAEGEIFFSETAAGWTVLCNRCCLRIEISQEAGEIKTYGDLRRAMEMVLAR